MENEHIRAKIKLELKHLLNITNEEFLNVDIALSFGVILIQVPNIRYKDILSKIVEIDNILGDILEADILNTDIKISYPFTGDDNPLRVEIHFSYDD